eukprot:TRINITY_DN17761_c0_g2_i4.p1 TRINITY_DN17761_c0_g2~~TRINITY_DN17761_c0_g2_i4.p1  ORF type:complete len:233 (-),score=-14.45 TRINITY_DN17761_c0_g2_i4:1207-1905(-)
MYKVGFFFLFCCIVSCYNYYLQMPKKKYPLLKIFSYSLIVTNSLVYYLNLWSYHHKQKKYLYLQTTQIQFIQLEQKSWREEIIQVKHFLTIYNFLLAVTYCLQYCTTFVNFQKDQESIFVYENVMITFIVVCYLQFFTMCSLFLISANQNYTYGNSATFEINMCTPFQKEVYRIMIFKSVFIDFQVQIVFFEENKCNLKDLQVVQPALIEVSFRTVVDTWQTCYYYSLFVLY